MSSPLSISGDSEIQSYPDWRGAGRPFELVELPRQFDGRTQEPSPATPGRGKKAQGAKTARGLLGLRIMTKHAVKRDPPEKSPTRKVSAHRKSVAHSRPDSGEAFLHDPTELHPRMHSNDELAEMLGEEFVRAATSGEDTDSDDVGAIAKDALGNSFNSFPVAEASAPTGQDTTPLEREPTSTPRPKQMRIKFGLS